MLSASHYYTIPGSRHVSAVTMLVLITIGLWFGLLAMLLARHAYGLPVTALVQGEPTLIQQQVEMVSDRWKSVAGFIVISVGFVTLLREAWKGFWQRHAARRVRPRPLRRVRRPVRTAGMRRRSRTRRR